MLRHTRKRCVRWSVVVLLTLTAGCGGVEGPELGLVRGRVTLGGQALADASIVFVPPEGRASAALTDKEGSYELGYAGDLKGAVVGSHTIRITTYRPARDTTGEKAVKETVPTKYNAKSELTREVKSGKNQLDFELDPNGEIIQPSTAD